MSNGGFSIASIQGSNEKLTVDEFFDFFSVKGFRELDSYKGYHAVLSILDPRFSHPQLERLEGCSNRTILRFHDELVLRDKGTILPDVTHIRAIIDFGTVALNQMQALGVRETGPTLIHCHSGISRSTAAIAILATRFVKPGQEKVIFEKLLSVRPQAWPNSLMLAIADNIANPLSELRSAVNPLFLSRLANEPGLEKKMERLRRSDDINRSKL